MRTIVIALILFIIIVAIYLFWFLVLEFPSGFLHLGFWGGSLLNLILTLMTIQGLGWILKFKLSKRK